MKTLKRLIAYHQENFKVQVVGELQFCQSKMLIVKIISQYKTQEQLMKLLTNPKIAKSPKTHITTLKKKKKINK